MAIKWNAEVALRRQEIIRRFNQKFVDEGFKHDTDGSWEYSASKEPIYERIKAQRDDFLNRLKEMAAKGVWLTKAGFGAVQTPFDYVPLIAWAKKYGMITTVHTGGSSIPGSAGIWAEHLIAMQPHVSFHVNGGPVAMPDEHYPRLINESQIAMQVVTAGNLRTTLMIGDLCRKADQFDRFLIATDTPTGSGIMPLGMLYMIT